jgi:hypothetical protein
MSSSGLDSDSSRRKTDHEASRSSTSTAVTDAQRGLARRRRKRATAKRRAQAATGRSCGSGPDPTGRAMRPIRTEVGSSAVQARPRVWLCALTVPCRAPICRTSQYARPPRPRVSSTTSVHQERREVRARF